MNAQPLSIATPYNILCLGETGSGKTMTLASLKSYVELDTWKKAYLTTGFEFPTKLKFEISKGRTNPPFKVNFGDDDNEDHSVSGQSYTQTPKTYRINYENTIYNFIDVPGSGDTRGVAQDDKNNKHIIQVINKYDKIHMILVFMKSSDGRLSDKVTYSLNEILAKLYKKNRCQIGFVVTHTKVADYEVGNAMNAIKLFAENLQRQQNITVKIDRDNIYPIEHDAFKVFVGLQQEPELENKINLEIFKESWQESRATVIKLLQDIPKRIPQEFVSYYGLMIIGIICIGIWALESLIFKNRG